MVEMIVGSTLFPRPKKQVMQASSANMERGLESHRTASCCRGRIWTFTLQRGSEKIFLFHPINNDIPSGWGRHCAAEIFQTSPLEKEHCLVR
jgi:hypothetical protein